ncbi:hypothetical protein NVP1131O_67 [Vibrio phage 1.131.O._10N.222.49.A8]|nr:hypothetical protein NVP1131O_67 [Vibrio phage 1.131.O._10N.222.49.A8]
MYSIKKEVGDIAVTFTAETVSEVIELADQYAERENHKKRKQGGKIPSTEDRACIDSKEVHFSANYVPGKK